MSKTPFHKSLNARLTVVEDANLQAPARVHWRLNALSESAQLQQGASPDGWASSINTIAAHHFSCPFPDKNGQRLKREAFTARLLPLSCSSEERWDLTSQYKCACDSTFNCQLKPEPCAVLWL